MRPGAGTCNHRLSCTNACIVLPVLITAVYLNGLKAYLNISRVSFLRADSKTNSLALHTRLLRSVSRNHIHQVRAQAVVARQALLLKRRSNTTHLLRIEALLDNTAHERCELRLLPLILHRPELAVNEVQALERMVCLNAPEHVHAARFACVALDHCRWVDDLKLVSVCADVELFSGDHADDGEECPIGLPALRTAARVVESDIGVESDLYRLRVTFASQFTAGAIVCLLLLEASVDGGVECLR